MAQIETREEHSQPSDLPSPSLEEMLALPAGRLLDGLIAQIAFKKFVQWDGEEPHETYMKSGIPGVTHSKPGRRPVAHYSASWIDAGPLLEDLKIDLAYAWSDKTWGAYFAMVEDVQIAETPMLAICRASLAQAYDKSKVGG